MISAGWHRRPRTGRGWWAVAVRILALVFALSVKRPSPVSRPIWTTMAAGPPASGFATVGAPAGTDAADPGLACHLHCGCHHLAAVAIGSRIADPRHRPPVYARVTEKVSSLAPDGLLRPPPRLMSDAAKRASVARSRPLARSLTYQTEDRPRRPMAGVRALPIEAGRTMRFLLTAFPRGRRRPCWRRCSRRVRFRPGVLTSAGLPRLLFTSAAAPDAKRRSVRSQGHGGRRRAQLRDQVRTRAARASTPIEAGEARERSREDDRRASCDAEDHGRRVSWRHHLPLTSWCLAQLHRIPTGSPGFPPAWSAPWPSCESVSATPSRRERSLPCSTAARSRTPRANTLPPR